MKRLEARICTTHVDRHGERLPLVALESMLFHYQTQYIPLGIDHDPRIPPQGRVVAARIVQLEDGHHAIDADIEVFEEGDQPQLEPGHRELPTGRFDGHEIVVMSDRALRGPADQLDIEEIAGALRGHRTEEVKKAAEPIAILTIAGTFVLGALATGFLTRAGEDGYEAVKRGLKRLFARRNEQPDETLLRLVLAVRDGDRLVEIEMIASRPGEADIEALLHSCLDEIEVLVPQLLASGPDLRRFVFEYKERRLILRFAVRRDALPILPTQEG